MTRELEVKFKIGASEPLRQRLHALGGTRTGTDRETNRIFDYADGRLRDRDCGLRIRACTALDVSRRAATTATVTYKGPREGGAFKSREEIETAIDDPDALATMLVRLGLVERIHFEKRRETWLLGGCEITLDEMPKLGWWIEIEGPDEETIESTRRTLNLDGHDPVSTTYVEMAHAHGHTDATGCRVLLFED